MRPVFKTVLPGLVVLMFGSCSAPVLTPLRDDFLPGRRPTEVVGSAYPDLVFANNGQSDLVFLGSASGFDSGNPVDGSTALSTGVALGDSTGDGIDDLVIATASTVSSFQGLGNGSFSFINSFNAGTTNASDVVKSDIDGDGDLDVAISGSSTPGPGGVSVLPGDNTGSLGAGGTEQLFDSIGGVASGIVAFDASNDGDTDLIVGSVRLDVLRNPGTGILNTPQQIGSSGGAATSIAAGDLDKDGFPDIVAAYTAGGNFWFKGDGADAFVNTAPIDPTTTDTYGVAIGDVNNDTNLDVVFANNGLNQVYLGNGTGGFDTGTNIGAETVWSYDVALADVNLDGNLDVIFANGGASGELNHLYYGDGTGLFGSVEVIGTDSSDSRSVAVGDFD